MPAGRALPAPFATTRDTLHRVAAHILGRRRHAVSGRFGLRAGPGGIATPAFGEGPEILRLAGDVLVREVAGATRYGRVTGSTMRDLAAFCDVDFADAYSSGPDTPRLGDPGAVIDVDLAAAASLAEWFSFGWQVLDQVLGALSESAEPDVIQLWPEHFDAGTSVALHDGSRVNLGASPGDAAVDEPYLYVGPRTADRPGDPAFWNAPFGAVLRWGELRGGPDPVGLGASFLRTGLGHLTGGSRR